MNFQPFSVLSPSTVKIYHLYNLRPMKLFFSKISFLIVAVFFLVFSTRPSFSIKSSRIRCSYSTKFLLSSFYIDINTENNFYIIPLHGIWASLSYVTITLLRVIIPPALMSRRTYSTLLPHSIESGALLLLKITQSRR